MLTATQNAACASFVDALVTAGLLGPGGIPGAIAELDLRAFDAWPPSPVVIWAPEVTAQQKAAWDSLVAGWDWGDPAQATRGKVELRKRAKAVIDTASTPLDVALVAAAKVLRKRVSDNVAAFNALRVKLIANGQNMTGVAALPAFALADALNEIRAQIDVDVP